MVYERSVRTCGPSIGVGLSRGAEGSDVTCSVVMA